MRFESEIPRSWDISPEWMTAALRQSFPGVAVTSVEQVGGSDGTSSRAVLALQYSGAPGPTKVFAKTKGDPLRRSFQWMTDNSFLEGRLAASQLALPIEHPAFYAGLVDRLRLNDMVVMEDVTERGATLNDATKPLTIDEVANGLRGLARLHSRFWGFTSASEPQLAWVGPWRTKPTFRFLVRLGTSRGLPRLRDQLPDSVAQLGQSGLIDHWVRQIRTVNQGPQTLLHGDAHVGNTYTLPGGEVGFYDWGVVRRGHWSFDVGYFLISSLDVDDRRIHARDLIEVYRTELDVSPYDRPSSDEAWLRFRSSTPYGLAIWITTGAEDGYQAPEVCANLVARFGHAFEDLDTPAALAQLEA
jgi:Phosphotransferase enzyme family